MQPIVSIVICTYKRPQLIRKAIKSVLDQTLRDFEIVVIDDSPDDETEKVARSFNDERIKYIKNEVRRGFVACRNQGVRSSSPDSKYIGFLDDDDEWLPKFLERTVGRLEERKDLSVVTTYAELRTKSGEKLPKMHGKVAEWWRAGIGNAHVMRKEIFTKDNIWYDEKMRFSEDMDIGFRILQHHKIESIPEVLYKYYFYPTVRGETLSTAQSPKTSSEDMSYYYRKHQEAYKKIGRKAFGWFNFFTGLEFCKAGKIKEGKDYLLRACMSYPHPRYLLYYFLCWVYPGSFRNTRLKIIKQKILRGI